MEDISRNSNQPSLESQAQSPVKLKLWQYLARRQGKAALEKNDVRKFYNRVKAAFVSE
jgi:hypothetical protein